MANTDRLSKTIEGTGLVLSAVSKFKSVDFDDMSSADAGLTITSGVLDIVSGLSSFLPPPVSTITPIISEMFNMFLPGPPAMPSLEAIKGLFLEQQTFITNEFEKQKAFIAGEFDQFTQELMSFSEDIFSKEFLRETKTDALALLDQVKEQYDYILPHANVILTEAEALDLDQHVSSMASTFHSARAKHAFTDRCPDVFSKNDNTDEAVNTRKLCALLLETYFSIEKFRDITLSQLIAILERSPLKNLVSGYLIIMDNRKTAMETFVYEYLLREEDPENTDMFCPLFQPCEISYEGYCPWISDAQRQGIQDYLNYISPESKDVWSNIYHLCNVRTFDCLDNDNCQVSIQYYMEDEDYLDIAWPYGYPWDISFVGENEVTIETQQGIINCYTSSTVRIFDSGYSTSANSYINNGYTCYTTQSWFISNDVHD